jgi:iron complex outermembrane recepter protein
MHKSAKLSLLGGAAISGLSFGLCLGFAAMPAYAQTPTATEADPNVVVVTARRRQETLKDVPIAVTSFSEEKLSRTGATDITALQQATPNLTMQVARGSNSTLIAFIRGVGQQDPLWGFEPGVGLYVDDVYIARPQGAVLDVFDIQRIEVLRGPQGTLYGRNTIGGAVKYVTKPLSFTQPSLLAKGTLGSYNEQDIVLSGSVPLSDMFAIGGAVALNKHDGYGKNLTTGAEHYNKDTKAYRLSADFKPNDTFVARFSYDKYQDDSNPRHGHREAVALNAAGTPFYTGTNAAIGLPPADIYDTYAGLGDKNKVTTEGASVALEYKLSDKVTLKSITAARKGETRSLIDFDNTPAKLLDVPAAYDDKQTTQEFQVLYTGEHWSSVAGVYYLNGQASGAFDTQVSSGGATVATQGKVSTISLAAFFDSSLKVNDKLSLSVGGRYTKDEKRGQVFRATYLGAPSPLFGGTQTAPFLLRTNYTKERSFEKFTPRLSASYVFTPDLTGYVSVSEGFKSGGFDMRGDAIFLPATTNGYAPESVLTYETGLKGTLFDKRLNFSSAIFSSQYSDMQITRQTAVGTTVASQVENAGKASIKGVEFEGNFRIIDGLTASTTIGYIDAKYDEFLSYDLTTAKYVNLAGLAKFQNTPEWTNSFGLTWRTSVAGGTVTVAPQASYRSDMQMFEFAAPLLDQKAFWLYDLGVSWARDHYKIGIYGKNLSEEKYKIGGYNFPGASLGNSITSYYGPPRTVLVSLEYKY